jgi:hypothetical protein
MKKTAVAFCAVVVLFGTARAEKPDWQLHIDWAIQDKGAVDCPAQYYEVGASDCVYHDGRACLMQRAISFAKNNNNHSAMRLTLITQCHNQQAQQAISSAGVDAVGDYLRQR